MPSSDKFKDKKLTQEQIDSIGGGFKQEIPGTFSYGCIIKCPKCGNTNQAEFYGDSDILAEVQKDLYTCAICGQQFAAATGYGITDII